VSKKIPNFRANFKNDPMQNIQNIEKEAVSLIAQQMKERGWNISELAKRMGMNSSTVAKMFRNENIKLNKLMEFAELFGFNFLRVLADKSEINNPPKLVEDHTNCQLRFRELEIENATLLKVLGK
jgi:transcriptional regulator with XRE-family HTH domain